MKSKLTLTIDSQLIPKAKAMAGKHGKSLSGWVEEKLHKEIVATEESEDPDPIGKWSGMFKDVQDVDAARLSYIKRKFGI